MEKDYLPTAYQEFIYKSRYSRWLEEENRREDWPETVERYVSFMSKHLKDSFDYADEQVIGEIRDAILNLDVMPSMRALMTAGPALERSHIASFNCAYAAVDRPEAFDEALYILMNGTGFGFSVEKEAVARLPVIPEEFTRSSRKFMVEDSKEGWAYALKHVVSSLYSGVVPDWDTSNVRLAGERLKTFGGRASGPEPLNKLLNRTIEVFIEAKGRKLTPLECHDLMCEIAEIVVVGGVRRAALISLSNLDDEAMRESKSGSWWEDNAQRALANNSAIYESKPEEATFWAEWEALEASGSGERGIINRSGMHRKMKDGGRDTPDFVGVNPCAEILMRSAQFCNLTSVTIGANDTKEDLERKVRIASVMGTFQSSLTDFPYLSKRWQENCEEERLLGVSLNGVFNNPLTWRNDDLGDLLDELRGVARSTNEKLAAELGINASAAITTIKPEGTTSQLVNVPSGIHPWYDKKYIRRVRGDKKDPLGQFLAFYGVVSEPEKFRPDATEVFSFPIAAPDGAASRHDLSAVEHLEIWRTYSRHWTEHNPSVTISVKEQEWEEVGKWVYENFDEVVGVSFLPWDGGSYEQAPYEAVTEERLHSLRKETPATLPWHALSLFETEDATKGSQELACVAGGCEIQSV